MPQGFQLSESLNLREDHNALDQNGYQEPEIEAIKDPAAAATHYEITSVPSPYARWHLFDQAFKWVAERALSSNGADLEGNTIYHKLVAEALDVGEIIFARKSINAKGDRDIKIRSFKFRDEVESLKEEADIERRNLGETYDLFGTINRENGEKISLYDAEEIHLLYIDGVAVGGTSPLSMYFTGADDLSEFSFRVDGTEMFKAPHESLILRGQAFMMAQMALVKQHSTTIKRFMPGFYSYVNYVDTMLRNRRDQAAYDRQTAERYVDMQHGAESLTVLKTISGDLFLYGPKAVGVDNSDLILGTLDGTLPDAETKRPLVLLPDFRRRCSYYNKVKWDPSVLEGYAGYPEDILQRTLPGQHVEHPWLTVSDFLEPTIFRLPGPLDVQRFRGNPGHKHGHNLDNESGDYLLPIKPLFFRFFTWENLFGKVHGKPMLEMSRTNGDQDVEVILRIPIGDKQEMVEMRRKYEKGAIANEIANQGAVEGLLVNLGLVPDVVVPRYKNGQVIMQEVQNIEYPTSLSFFASWDNTEERPLEPVAGGPTDPILRVDPGKYSGQGTKVYHPTSRFDMVRVDAGKTGGWLFLDNVPQVDEAVSKQFDLAIDFGTTNTHVAIRERTGGDYAALELKHPEACLRTLFPASVVPRIEVLRTNLFMRSFYHEIGPGKLYNFPLRTAIAESEAYNGPDVMPIARMNIPFYYLNESSPVPDQIYTNLKWSDLRQEQDKSRLNHFISALLQIAALEIQARGGDPSKVNLVYFFPSSMDWKRQEELTKAWKAAYSRYFGTSGGFVQALSESVAPYQYFAYAEPSIINGKNVINCDIGGGTCDAYIHYRGTTTPEMPKIASFRFGGNAVFGDGYDTNKGKKNGFIGACKDAVENKLGEGSSSDHRTTRDAYQQLKDRAISSEEMISFFQSLSNRDMHKEVYFDFNEHVNLHRPQLNLVYLIYFGGIIYHLLEVTKSMGIDRPTNITFTGNGSKILQALASDRILSVIANYLAEGVYGEGEGGADALSIKTFEKPKDYTSLGGLAMIKNKEQLDTEFTPPQNVVVLGIDEQMSGKDMYFVREGGQIVGEAPNYGKVLTGGDYEQKTVANVERFLDILFDVNRKFSFKANLGLDIRDMEGAKAEIKSYLSMGYTYGVEERIEQGNATQAVEETLFFHPLRNAIYNLGMTLAKRVL